VGISSERYLGEEEKGEGDMESRQIDVSRLAELSAVGLLAAKVRIALGRARRSQTVREAEARGLEGAVRYLNRLVEGLNQLRASGGNVRPPGPNELNAIESYLTAEGAVCSVASGPCPTPDAATMDDMDGRLAAVRSELERAISTRVVRPADISEADLFFASLADYANAEHQKMLRASLI